MHFLIFLSTHYFGVFFHAVTNDRRDREVKDQKGETGHQLNKDTNYGPQNFNPFLKKTLNTHSGAKKQLVYSK